MGSEARFLEVFNRVEPYIEGRYSIPVVISDVPKPYTGDLDGAEIRVDHENDAETRPGRLRFPIRAVRLRVRRARLVPVLRRARPRQRSK